MCWQETLELEEDSSNNKARDLHLAASRVELEVATLVEEDPRDSRVEAILVEDLGWEGVPIILEGCREEVGMKGALGEAATIEEILEVVGITGEILGEIVEAIGIEVEETECNS